MLHQPFHPALQAGAGAGHTGHGHQVGKAAAGGGDADHAPSWSCGGHQQHQIQALGGSQGGQLGRFLQGQVGHHKTGRAGGGGLLAEALHAPAQQGVAVGEQHHGSVQLPLEAGEHLQHPARGGARGQGPAGGGLNHGPIGEGIAVGDAELNQVGASPLEGQQAGPGRGQVGIASHEEGHQGAAPLLLEPGETALDQGGGSGNGGDRVSAHRADW